jgi:peroxiredoxin Q/BCP
MAFMRLFALVCLGAALAAWLAADGAVARGADAPKTGDVAPDFSLPGSDGKTHQLAGFKGKKAVVLAWFPKAFTGG